MGQIKNIKLHIVTDIKIQAIHIYIICKVSRNKRFQQSALGVSAVVETDNKMSSAASNLITVLTKLYKEYNDLTPQKLKIIDSFLLYVMVTGIFQFLYCCLVGTFPFNSFLSGFISCVGTFVLGVCLRVQTNPRNQSEFRGISPERAFADFIFANIILHLVVMNFIG